MFLCSAQCVTSAEVALLQRSVDEVPPSDQVFVLIQLPYATNITWSGYGALRAWALLLRTRTSSLALRIHQPDLWRQVTQLHLDDDVVCMSALPAPVAMQIPV